MARKTLAQIVAGQLGVDAKVDPEDLLAILVAAENPDGSQFSLPVESPKPAAADILNGHLGHVATTGVTTLITIPAGRTWVGEVAIACATSVAAASNAAGQALGTITTAGAGVTPPASTVASCEARAGANAATGTVGSEGNNSVNLPLVVIAPPENDVTIRLASTIVGSGDRVSAMASGRLL